MRLMIIGIDGMDHQLGRRWLDRLPTFHRLAHQGIFQPLRSVFPPDSVPAWVSFYLGVEPAEHGLLQSVDYVNAHGGSAPDPAAFAGRTFWDEASAAGYRVAILNPFLAYPVWPVRGVMISGPVFATGNPQSYPEDALAQLPPAHLGGFVEFPSTRQLAAFARSTHRVARRQAVQAAALARQTEWDLFFVTFLTLDRIQHFYWRFHDPDDPAWPGPTPLASAIFDHYRLLDDTVARLLANRPSDCAVLVLSDHGHGRRPTRLFHINEWLRRQGLLAPPPGAACSFSSARLLEFGKHAALQTAHRFELEDTVFALAQLLPPRQRRSLQRSDFVLRGRRTPACRDPFGGNSPYGGIRLDSEAILATGRSPQALRDTLIRQLEHVRDPLLDDTIVHWVKSREAKVSGRRVHVYPEILYRLKSTWGTDPSLFTAPFSPSPLHRRLSGGHRPTGVLFAAGVPRHLPPPPALPALRAWLLELLAA